MSHAKASSAGSTKHHLGRPALALSLFAVVLVALGLLVPAVGAAPKHPFKETFGSAAQPSFTEAEGMAVVQSSGDLLVIDAGAKTLSRFKANGEPRPFSALGTNVIDGKKGPGGKDCAEEPSSCDLTPLEEVLGSSTSPREVQVAVDESGGITDGNIYLTNGSNALIDIFASDGHHIGQLSEAGTTPFVEACGVAVDPNGAVYVGDYSASSIHKFVPSANPPLSTDNKANFSFGTPCTLAAGAGPSAGSLFAVHYGSSVEKLDASTGEVKYTVPSVGATVSVDPVSGHVFVTTGNAIDEYDASGTSPKFLSSTPLGAEAFGVAALGDKLYASRAGSSNVEVFGPPPLSTGNATQLPGSAVTLNGTVNPEGALVKSCTFEYGETAAYGQTVPCAESPAEIGTGSSPQAVHADVSGLKTGVAYNFRLIATLAGDRDEEGLDAGFFVLGPRITSTAVHVTDTTARLDAQINPASEETTYQFEYLSQADYEANGNSFSGPRPASKVPVAAKSIGAGSEVVKVTEQATGLSPQTTYRFRIVATNPGGSAAGPEEVLTTYSPPLIGLPDGRAYEQATPLNKDGGNVQGNIDHIQAAQDGSGITFYSTAGFPGGEGGQNPPFFLASRYLDGWSSQGLLPPASTGPLATTQGWSEDLSSAYVSNYKPSLGLGTLYQRDNATHSLRVIASAEGGSFDPKLAGASVDGAEVIFETKAKLLPAAVEGKSNVYLWDKVSEELKLASALNDGTPPPQGAFAGPYNWFLEDTATDGGANRTYYTQANHAISADGASVYFTAAGSGKLYLRHNPTEAQSPLDGDGNCTDPDLACTVEVSAPQRTSGSDPAGQSPAAFMAATPDGSRSFFTSSEKLTDDATTGPEPAIGRGNLDGSGIDREFLPTRASSIAVNGSHIYWANPKTNSIARANLDGTNPQEAFITGASDPQGVAVNGTYVYWTNAGTNSIARAKLDGTEANQSFISGASNPEGIAVNAEHIYWANAGTHSIGRADIGGSSPEPSFIPVSSSEIPHGVALDASHIFWTVSLASNSFVVRVDLDASNERFIFVGATNARGIAVDGSHVYWANEETNSIGRADPDLPIGEDQSFIIGANGPRGLAVDASNIYWSSNAHGGNKGNDLYRYDAVSNELMDVSVDPSATNGADVKGVLGISDDGSHVYFVANGVLTNTSNASGTESATPGDCTGTTNPSGTCNLYLWNEGTVTFITRLTGVDGVVISDTQNWRPLSYDGTEIAQRTARVSADGETLLFRSLHQLTDYENEGVAQLYRYNTDEGLNCVSCNPTGAPPAGVVNQRSIEVLLRQSPAPTITRNLSADGKRVFFETPDQLVANDTNGFGSCPNQEFGGPAYIGSCQDVYEWEANGSGTCHSDAQNGGCLYLLSSGTSPDPSYFADAGVNGNDAFIFTNNQLVAQDKDELTDIYDVRVGGGIASQNAVAPVPCEGEACKGGATAPPVSQSPSTATFSGPGNQKPNHKKKRKHAKKHKKKSKSSKHRQTRAQR